MFDNRRDGGEQLGFALQRYRGDHPIILGIPRGGVEPAYYVASLQQAEMSLVVTRKLGYPMYPETAFGAIAEDGSIYLDDSASDNLSAEEMQQVIAKEQTEMKRRIKVLRNGKPLPVLKDRTVILVDDGIATGATIFASIALCKKQGAAKIVVATPVAGQEMKSLLQEKVDDVVILEEPLYYHAVSQGYSHFENLSDAETLLFINKLTRKGTVAI